AGQPVHRGQRGVRAASARRDEGGGLPGTSGDGTLDKVDVPARPPHQWGGIPPDLPTSGEEPCPCPLPASRGGWEGMSELASYFLRRGVGAPSYLKDTFSLTR